MKQTLLIITALMLIVGCVPPPTFTIEPIGDKFTNPNQPKGFIGTENRLSKKSSMGGVHIDNKGVYINPYVYKDDGGSIVRVGFSVYHMNFEYKNLFRPIQSIVFLNQNDERVEIKCKSLDVDVDLGYYNPISRDLQGTASETNDCECNEKDFKKLVGSTSIEIKISGGERSMVYETTEVLPSFLQNLKTFYNQQMQN